MPKEMTRAMVLASFAADSLALGAHWIYDTEQIESRFGRVDRLLKPGADSPHPTKDQGEFTHYGDQTLVLLDSVAASSGFDLDHFCRSWRDLFAHYDGYFDHATKGTLSNFQAGKGPTESGSSSTDLAGAARIAPLVYRYQDDLQALVASSRAQTVMTHNNPAVIGSAEFFARVAFKVLHGLAPVAAITETRDESFRDTPFAQRVDDGLASVEESTRQAIADFGQHCATEGAFRSVIHLLAKYENDLPAALVENVMAGGDSAARGLLAGMILGAHLGGEAIPLEWLSGLKVYRHIVDQLKAIDPGSGT